jgi:hypothetical protein
VSESAVLHQWRDGLPNEYRVVRGEWQGASEPPVIPNSSDAWLEVVDACNQWLGIGVVDYAVADELSRLSTDASQVRDEALEDAALICEGLLATDSDLEDCALAIRALKSFEEVKS